jgi:hypothetical protein
LRSAALRNQLKTQGLSLAFGSAPSAGEALRKLEAGEADLAVVSLSPDWTAPPGNPSVGVALKLADSSAANTVVMHEPVARFLELLDENKTFVYARETADEALAKNIVSALKFPSQPKLDEMAGAEAVFERLRNSSGDWASHVYVLPAPAALEAERLGARILIEAGGVEVLAANRAWTQAHADDLAVLFKAYFTALDAVASAAGGMERELSDNSTMTAADAQRIVAHSRWLNAAENYAEFGLSEPGSAIPDKLQDATVLKTLFSANFHVGALETRRADGLPALNDAQWENSFKRDVELKDRIEFQGRFPVIESTQENEESVKKIGRLLNLLPNEYAVIQGGASGDRDLEIAVKRAEAVKAFLQTHCRINGNRLRTEVKIEKWGDSHFVSVILLRSIK